MLPAPSNHVNATVASSTVKPPSSAVSARAAQLPPFIAMDVASTARSLEAADPPPARKILHLEIGQPVLPTPPRVLSAAASALSGPLFYTSAVGIPQLRSAIASLYHRRYATHVSPDHVIVASGASGALQATFAACFDPGHRVAVTIPTYPCYTNVLEALGISLVPLRAQRRNSFQPTAEQVRQAAREAPLRGLVLASPANPTGGILSASELAAIAAVCAEERIILIVDEVYHGLTAQPVGTALDANPMHQPTTVVVGSFSKCWRMTGLRVGWAVCQDEELLRAIERILQSATICAPVIGQHAAVVAALGECDDEIAGDVEMYVAAMKALVSRLQKAGFEAEVPDGAFFVYAGCERVCEWTGVNNSIELCDLLLRRGGVACTPGMDFDREEGGKYIRFSCAGGEGETSEAGDRIVALVADMSKDRGAGA